MIIENNENLKSKDELIIIIIIEKESDQSLINNYKFYVYDLNNNKINLEICKNNNIPISIINNINLDETKLNLIKYYKLKYSIDITNPNDEFFNNYCISLETQEGLDISMDYRRSKIFIKNICGNNASYEINYKDSKISCLISDYNYDFENGEKREIENGNNNFIKNLVIRILI